MAESFNLLMKRVTEEGKFNHYKFNGGEDQFTHLQHADDILLIDEKKLLYYQDNQRKIVIL